MTLADFNPYPSKGIQNVYDNQSFKDYHFVLLFKNASSTWWRCTSKELDKRTSLYNHKEIKDGSNYNSIYNKDPITKNQSQHERGSVCMWKLKDWKKKLSKEGDK